MVVAVVAAKQCDRDDLAAFLAALHRKHPDATVVSDGVGGGAAAEMGWLDRGGNIVSFRAVTTPVNGSYVVQEWKLGTWAGNEVRYVSPLNPSFEDFGSARLYAQMQVAEFCDRMVVFQRDGTPEADTAITAGFGKDQGKDVYVYTPAAPFSRRVA